MENFYKISLQHEKSYKNIIATCKVRKKMPAAWIQNTTESVSFRAIL